MYCVCQHDLGMVQLHRDLTDFGSGRYIRRHLNVVDHMLAKSCKNLRALCVFPSVPDCIQETLCHVVP